MATANDIVARLSQHFDITLPLLILIVIVGLKLFVGQASITLPIMIETFYIFPVDMVVLSLTFTAASAITNTISANWALFIMIAEIGAAVIIVWLWRKSNDFFQHDRGALSVLTFVVNFTLSFSLLVFNLNLLRDGGPCR